MGPSSTCGQDQRSKGTMLYFKDTLFICSPLLTFVSSIASVGGGRTVRWCMGVENSDVKKGWLFAFVPKILSLDVKSCTFLGIGDFVRRSAYGWTAQISWSTVHASGTTLHCKNKKLGLSQMSSGYYICKIMVIGCFLIQAGANPSSVVVLYN